MIFNTMMMSDESSSYTQGAGYRGHKIPKLYNQCNKSLEEWFNGSWERTAIGQVSEQLKTWSDWTQFVSSIRSRANYYH